MAWVKGTTKRWADEVESDGSCEDCSSMDEEDDDPEDFYHPPVGGGLLPTPPVPFPNTCGGVAQQGGGGERSAGGKDAHVRLVEAFVDRNRQMNPPMQTDPPSSADDLRRMGIPVGTRKQILAGRHSLYTFTHLDSTARHDSSASIAIRGGHDEKLGGRFKECFGAWCKSDRVLDSYALEGHIEYRQDGEARLAQLEMPMGLRKQIIRLAAHHRAPHTAADDDHKGVLAGFVQAIHSNVGEDVLKQLGVPIGARKWMLNEGKHRLKVLYREEEPKETARPGQDAGASARELEELKKQLGEMVKTRGLLEDKVTTTQAVLASKVEEINKLFQEKHQADKSLAVAQAQLTDAAREQQELSQQLQQAAKREEALTDEIGRVRAQLLESRAALQDAHAEIERIKAKHKREHKLAVQRHALRLRFKELAKGMDLFRLRIFEHQALRSLQEKVRRHCMQDVLRAWACAAFVDAPLAHRGDLLAERIEVKGFLSRIANTISALVPLVPSIEHAQASSHQASTHAHAQEDLSSSSIKDGNNNPAAAAVRAALLSVVQQLRTPPCLGGRSRGYTAESPYCRQSRDPTNANAHQRLADHQRTLGMTTPPMSATQVKGANNNNEHLGHNVHNNTDSFSRGSSADHTSGPSSDKAGIAGFGVHAASPLRPSANLQPPPITPSPSVHSQVSLSSPSHMYQTSVHINNNANTTTSLFGTNQTMINTTATSPFRNHTATASPIGIPPNPFAHSAMSSIPNAHITPARAHIKPYTLQSAGNNTSSDPVSSTATPQPSPAPARVRARASPKHHRQTLGGDRSSPGSRNAEDALFRLLESSVCILGNSPANSKN